HRAAAKKSHHSFRFQAKRPAVGEDIEDGIPLLLASPPKVLVKERLQRGYNVLRRHFRACIPCDLVCHFLFLLKNKGRAPTETRPAFVSPIVATQTPDYLSNTGKRYSDALRTLYLKEIFMEFVS